MRKAAARLLIGGTFSGCGKTTVTCALLQALKNRGEDTAAFKCGPDYIDPMFHREVIGADSGNIDLFLSDAGTARRLFAGHARDLNVIEGVMGYYDGLSMTSPEASAWDVASRLDAPAVIVLPARGMALSAAAAVKGFTALRRPSRVQGVIFNRVTAMTYPGLKEAVEGECGVKAFGYMPEMPDCALESRHLGLITAPEVQGLREKLNRLADQAEKSLDIDGLISLMRSCPPLEAEEGACAAPPGRVRIAVSRDRAFCFTYRENLEALGALGAELVFFSPTEDKALPECDGLYLVGGYPELYADRLSENAGMRASVRDAVLGGLPTVAECGGFMYLTQSIAGRPMAGVLPGGCHDAGRLVRFGYVSLSGGRDSLLFRAGEEIRAHEFHHWDADAAGGDLTARKPSGRSWRCAYATDTLYAGFPHLYFPARPEMARRFVNACLERKNAR